MWDACAGLTGGGGACAGMTVGGDACAGMTGGGGGMTGGRGNDRQGMIEAHDDDLLSLYHGEQ